MAQSAIRSVSSNVLWNSFQLRGKRWISLEQRPAIVWFTGLPGSGKSSIAGAVDRYLTQSGRHTIVLDGDNLRHGLNRDLGFSAADRAENVRRTAEVARLMAEVGIVVIVSLISPFRKERAVARGIAGDIPFLEVFVDTPPSVCEDRDPKGLYSRARAGQIPDFTGISAPYEIPENPDLLVRTEGFTVEQSALAVIPALTRLTTPDSNLITGVETNVFDNENAPVIY